METIASMFGGIFIIIAIFGFFDNEDWSVPTFIFGWVLFIPLIIYSGSLSDISKYTVKDIKLISTEDKIYEVNLIKDPGIIFFNHHQTVYTTKPLNIGDLIDDTLVKGNSLISTKEIEVK